MDIDDLRMITIKGATEFSGISRSGLYVLIGDGAIEARKAGRRTLIVVASLARYLDSLPAADIRCTRKAAA